MTLIAVTACAAELEDPTGYDLYREAAAAADSGASCGIEGVFSQSCATFGCHGASLPAAGLDLENQDVAARTLNVPATHQHILDGSEASCLAGELLIDGDDPEQSVILKKVDGRHSCGQPMPIARPFSDADRSCVRQWVYEVAGKPLP